MDSNKNNCEHEFVDSEEYTGGTDYVCKKCGEKKTVSTLLNADLSFDRVTNIESEYVLLDPNKTTVLYSDVL